MGVGDTSTVVFLLIRLDVGEAAAGDSDAEPGAGVSARGVGSVAFCVRCFAGKEDSAGVPVSSCD